MIIIILLYFVCTKAVSLNSSLFQFANNNLVPDSDLTSSEGFQKFVKEYLFNNYLNMLKSQQMNNMNNNPLLNPLFSGMSNGQKNNVSNNNGSPDILNQLLSSQQQQQQQQPLLQQQLGALANLYNQSKQTSPFSQQYMNNVKSPQTIPNFSNSTPSLFQSDLLGNNNMNTSNLNEMMQKNSLY